MAAAMGIELLREEQYLDLQLLEEFVRVAELDPTRRTEKLAPRKHRSSKSSVGQSCCFTPIKNLFPP